ncbi:hypothetical protein PISL3812_01504 [Talaromyces islandicus]|uniref:Heme-binding protein HMX1 n=1 Tax=Talaromyces islandicus TaxID=28573 RepID=A0A0U1LP23_TALIS|nr:hypothetical protein PISL3812_01504 [Talaromyces islandicus]
MAVDACPAQNWRATVDKSHNANMQAADADLPTRIRAATRAIHHTLNTTIIRRLALGLPPETRSPQLYALGISRIAEIYYAFENAWRDYLDSPYSGVEIDARYRAILHDILIPGIARSQRLSSDLAHLRATWGPIDAPHHDEAIRSAVAHMSVSIQAKPYVVLAYSWIMYMALFNGGRWIREQLLDAGPSFWDRKSSHAEKAPIAQSYLSFWHFDGSDDGEDVKLAFKTRLIDAGSRLTEAEREDVVAEAQALFQHCLSIVMEIDTVVSSNRLRPVASFCRYSFPSFYFRFLVTTAILGSAVYVLSLISFVWDLDLFVTCCLLNSVHITSAT